MLLVVRFPAETSVVVLLRFDAKQPFLDERNQRKGSHTGLGFGGIRRHENVLIVEVHRGNGVPDDDGVVLKSRKRTEAGILQPVLLVHLPIGQTAA